MGGEKHILEPSLCWTGFGSSFCDASVAGFPMTPLRAGRVAGYAANQWYSMK